ncbi:MAG: LegC family aminotransferase [Deltaproteobacteria bacterium]|nr:LegC family aminotransferase [Deltaproteobacteria bacterium]MBI3295913.1 LegC family aminotransferase [Deltaproteobacteria bacterium]
MPPQQPARKIIAVEDFVPLSTPCVNRTAWTYVKECLDTAWVSSSGQFVNRFEKSVADYVGVKFGVATSNGTSAIHAALLAAGVGPDEEVIVSSLTFIASANAIRYTGAWPVFVDIEAKYWQMDSDKVKDFIVNGCLWKNGVLTNSITGRRVTAILPVHILGHPVDIDPIRALAEEYKIQLIEDAAESLGALYKGKKVGGLGRASCFSFNGNKIITCGGGGMVLTNDESLAKRARYLTTQAKDDEVENIHGEVGYNYRQTNIQAALGVAQMEVLPRYIEAKRRIAERYAAGLKGVKGIGLMQESPDAFSIFWLYTILIDSSVCGVDRRELWQDLASRGIETRPLWQPLHRSPAYATLFKLSCEVAEKIQAQALSLPSSVNLTESQQDRVIEAVREGVSLS